MCRRGPAAGPPGNDRTFNELEQSVVQTGQSARAIEYRAAESFGIPGTALAATVGIASVVVGSDTGWNNVTLDPVAFSSNGTVLGNLTAMAGAALGARYTTTIAAGYHNYKVSLYLRNQLPKCCSAP